MMSHKIAFFAFSFLVGVSVSTTQGDQKTPIQKVREMAQDHLSENPEKYGMDEGFCHALMSLTDPSEYRKFHITVQLENPRLLETNNEEVLSTIHSFIEDVSKRLAEGDEELFIVDTLDQVDRDREGQVIVTVDMPLGLAMRMSQHRHFGLLGFKEISFAEELLHPGPSRQDEIDDMTEEHIR